MGPLPRHDPRLRVFAHRFMTENAQRYGLAMVICGVLWWPLDPLLYEGDQLLAMTLCRFAIFAVFALFTAVRPVRELMARRPLIMATLWMGLAMFAAGLALGQGARTLEDGWAHYFMAGTFGSAVAVIELPRRVLLTLALAASGPVGFMIAQPSALSSPALPGLIAYSLAGVVLAVFAGHALTTRLIEHHAQERALERQGAELARLAGDLEVLAEEQTHELRRRAHDLLTQQEAERTRLALELHDGLGQQIATLGYALAYLQRLPPESRERGDVISECADLITAAHRTLAEVLDRLEPEVVAYGLEAALRDLVRPSTLPICPRLTTTLPPVPLPAELSLVAFRVVQEALSNALEHARASEITIDVALLGGRLELAIADDGIGLAPDAETRGGFGLDGIRSRVARLWGEVRWLPRKPHGTLVRASLPLTPPVKGP